MRREGGESQTGRKTKWREGRERRGKRKARRSGREREARRGTGEAASRAPELVRAGRPAPVSAKQPRNNGGSGSLLARRGTESGSWEESRGTLGGSRAEGKLYCMCLLLGGSPA